MLFLIHGDAVRNVTYLYLVRLITITAIRYVHPGQNKPSALEKVERLEKVARIGGVKITDASIENVGNGQMPFTCNSKKANQVYTQQGEEGKSRVAAWKELGLSLGQIPAQCRAWQLANLWTKVLVDSLRATLQVTHYQGRNRWLHWLESNFT